MFQPCHSCLAPFLGTCFLIMCQRLATELSPTQFCWCVFCHWDTNADEEEKSVLIKDSLYQVDLGFIGSLAAVPLLSCQHLSFTLSCPMELELCILMNWCLKKPSNVIKFCLGV